MSDPAHGPILALNVGSSSIKFALYGARGEGGLERLVWGRVEDAQGAPRLLAARGGDPLALIRSWPQAGKTEAGKTQAELLGAVLALVEEVAGGASLAACGHRVVHGGTSFAGPVLVDDEVLADLAALEPLAPLHQPQNLAAIRQLAALAPGVPQIACFDTAFHASMPALATRFALPRRLHEAGIRRYGFHGLSYAFLARELARMDPPLAQGRVIAAHLGSGASLCAMLGGRSVDTTMGFTALDGLMMGTRCGALDPGVVLHLVRQHGGDVAAVERLLYREAGLLGVSGLAGDMRALAASRAPEAEEAIALFCWRAAREAAALLASLGGLDGLVFTAGIGENSPMIRARIGALLGWCGVRIDPAANEAGAPLISAADSKVRVAVIATDEEAMIAVDVAQVLGRPAARMESA